MSSWVLVMPLHRYPVEDLAGRQVQGMPAAAPEPAPLPTVAAVLATLTEAGLHGDPWFQVEGTSEPLPRCPDPSGCDGLDLGEVRLQLAEPRDDPMAALKPDDPVELVAMRKPRGGLRSAVVALAATVPQIAFDDNFDVFVVVHPGDRVEDLATSWPW
jgi:hypothetical protein